MSASAPYVIAPVELILVLYKDEWKKTLGTKKSDINRKDPNRNIPHPEIVDWVTAEYKKRTGQVFRDPVESNQKTP